ncbi:hypothetical protein JXC34_06500, partial [Candidatus Woesearchaeota archaeon]|nr:hypothetical protein [Candidatus Woesearchaeota archaeon]
DLMADGEFDKLYDLVQGIIAKEDVHERAYDTVGVLRALAQKGKKLSENLEDKVSEELKKENKEREDRIKELEETVNKNKADDGFTPETLQEYMAGLASAIFHGTNLGISSADKGNYQLVLGALMPYLNAAAPSVGKKKGEELLQEIGQKINEGDITGEEGAVYLLRKYISKGMAAARLGGLQQKLLPESDTNFRKSLGEFVLNRHDFQSYLDLNEPEDTEIDTSVAAEAGYNLAAMYSNPRVSRGDLLEEVKKKKMSSKGLYAPEEKKD